MTDTPAFYVLVEIEDSQFPRTIPSLFLDLPSVVRAVNAEYEALYDRPAKDLYLTTTENAEEGIITHSFYQIAGLGENVPKVEYHATLCRVTHN